MTNYLPNLALCMIVKDEGHVIKETLECVSRYIDYYVVVDTGSTDDTKEIIKKFFELKGIPGEIISHEFRTCPLSCHGSKYKKWDWFHFGWNRSYAMQQCYGKSKYIWVMDADDIIVGDFKLPDEMTADSYEIRIGKNFTYKRPQIFKNDPSLNWHYKNPRHEYANTNKRNPTKDKIEGDYYMDSRRLGARSNNPNKYLDDAKVFEDKLKRNPKNDRYAFYCAQSYFDHGDYQNALKWYKKRIELQGWFEETFYSYYRVAMAMEKLGMPWIDVEKAYLDAHNYCKSRAEPFYNIAQHYIGIKDYKKAYTFLRKAVKIPYPSNCSLFVFKDMYDYKFEYQLAISAYHLNKFDESISISKKLLASNILPKDESNILNGYLNDAIAKNSGKEMKTCCLYIGNAMIVAGSELLQIINSLSKFYKIIVVGDKICQYYSTFTLINTNTFRLLGNEKTFDIDYLILYNSIEYFYLNYKIQCKKMILLLRDSKIKMFSNNGIRIDIMNSNVLNEVFNKLNICKIICDGGNNKELATNYKLDIEHVYNFNISDENDFYKIFECTNNKYKFAELPLNETNGFYYNIPQHIQILQNNRYVYAFNEIIITNIYNEIIRQYPQTIEHAHHIHKLGLVYLELGNMQQALMTIETALNLFKNVKCQNLPYKDSILSTKADILHKTEKYQESYDLADEVLRRSNIPDSLRTNVENIRDMNVQYIKDRTLFYNSNKVKNIAKLSKTLDKTKTKIMFSITTCKRYDLFEKTMNSFLNCCSDLEKIDYWLCVDDNSTHEDRNKMKKNYPFFNFVFKNENEKGHYKSMNIIHDYVTKNNVEFLLHIEDDWHFIQKRNYVSESIKILNENKELGQVLFNNYYGEIEPYHRRCKGGILMKTIDGIRYYVHEHYEQNSKEYSEYMERNSGFGTHGYWPHFSFRPSVLKTSVLRDVGKFYNTAHFEMQYANEYKAKGYKSAFFDTFCSIHTGKKTWERDGTNSYNLNQMGQFTLTDNNISVHVISNNKDASLWTSFKESAIDQVPHITRHNIQQVTELNAFEKKIFANNTFNYLRAVINDIVVRINVFRQNNSKYILVLKENVTLNSDFKVNLDKLVNLLKNQNADIILLDNTSTNNNADICLVDGNVNDFDMVKQNGYLISDLGAKKILAHITINGIKDNNYMNGIKNFKICTINKQIYSVTPIIDNKDISFVHLDGYKFYSQLDSFGNDIDYFGRKTVEEYKEICEKKGGNCFNTLGYIKNKVDDEKNFIYLPHSTRACDGLYVKI